MKNKLLLILTMLIIGIPGLAQSQTAISGTVRDEKTGETLIAATITVRELPTVGAVTNEYGFYSLSLPSGVYTLRISYTGYQALEATVNGSRKQRVFSLTHAAGINEVVVKANPAKSRITNPQMG